MLPDRADDRVETVKKPQEAVQARLGRLGRFALLLVQARLERRQLLVQRRTKFPQLLAERSARALAALRVPRILRQPPGRPSPRGRAPTRHLPGRRKRRREHTAAPLPHAGGAARSSRSVIRLDARRAAPPRRPALPHHNHGRPPGSAQHQPPLASQLAGRCRHQHPRLGIPHSLGETTGLLIPPRARYGPR